MMPMNKNKSQSGFTLVELIATVVISLTSLSSLIYIFGEINHHIVQETLQSDMDKYCERALDDIAYSIRASKDISYSMYGMYQKIIVDLGGNNRVTYTVSETEGILKNGKPIGHFRLKDKDGNRIWKIADFSCNTPTDWPMYSDSKVKNATYNVQFSVDHVDKFRRNKVLKTITSEREVFSPSKYRRSFL